MDSRPRKRVRVWALAASLGLVVGHAQAQNIPDQIDESGPAVRSLTGAAHTGEALWPVPPRAEWGQVTLHKGPNIWKDAVFTHPDGRWQMVYPSTMTDPYGDFHGAHVFRYPGQPHITCGFDIEHGVLRDLGERALLEGHQALESRMAEAVAAYTVQGAVAENIQLIALPSPPGSSGRPVQAVQFDQKGKLLETMGVQREVVMRTVIVTLDDALLGFSCTAHPGQRKWVEKQVATGLRLTGLAREPRE